MKTIATLVLLLAVSLPALAQTTKNDDSCDISVLPAATLLLPYFEVDIASPRERARTTFFSITNTTREPQIARVTIWTDWAFPVLSFNVFLTGYDVHAVNLHDVLTGTGTPANNTSNATTPGSRSLSNVSGNTNFLPSAATDCAPGARPSAIPAGVLADVQSALTTGQSSACGTSRIGGRHLDFAVGYVTIDLVATCTTTPATDASYYANELLFDNVLTGEYEHFEPNSSYADAGPMVHIRAVPEGGRAASRTDANLPQTFYSRYTPAGARTADRRQPLPSVFAARYVQGSVFATAFRIWRETVTGASAECAAYAENSHAAVPDIVRFDERENATTLPLPPGTPFSPVLATLPATSILYSTSSILPPLASGDAGGWIYFNLGRPIAGSSHGTQNWISVSMTTAAGHDLSFDATALGNGCSARAAFPADARINPIGPRP
jgi:hypothetical protein